MVLENSNNKIFSPLVLTAFVICSFIFACQKFNLYSVFKSEISRLFPENLEKILDKASAKESVYLGNKQAQKYVFDEKKDYDNILKFNENNKDIYVFNIETQNLKDDKSKIAYELGRIYLNINDKNKSQCTYNYGIQAYGKNVEYFPCSETQFLKSLPEIATLKNDAYEKLKNTTDEYNRLKYCESLKNYKNNSECFGLNDTNFSETTYERLDKLREYQLKNLLDTTLNVL